MHVRDRYLFDGGLALGPEEPPTLAPAQPKVLTEETGEGCGGSAVDLMFLLDGSGSIENPALGGAPGNFKNKIVAFVKQVVSESNVADGARGVRVAVATFSSDVTVNFNLAARSKADVEVTPPFVLRCD